jgi:hypothetical protein
MWVKPGNTRCEQMFSALHLKADILRPSRHVRFVPRCDIARLLEMKTPPTEGGPKRKSHRWCPSPTAAFWYALLQTQPSASWISVVNKSLISPALTKVAYFVEFSNVCQSFRNLLGGCEILFFGYEREYERRQMGSRHTPRVKFPSTTVLFAKRFE